MKKKGFAIALACAFAFPMAALAACGDDDKSGDDGKNDKDPIATDKVDSAEAWAAAFKFDGIQKITCKNTMLNDDVTTSETIYKFDGDKTYYKASQSNSIIEQYFTVESDVDYVLHYDGINNSWVRNVNEGTAPAIASLFGYWNLDGKYASFTYSETQKAYVADGIAVGGVSAAKITVKINNGNVIYLRADATMPSPSAKAQETVKSTSITECSDIGTTTVTLPPYTDAPSPSEELGTEVSADEWTAMSSHLTNYAAKTSYFDREGKDIVKTEICTLNVDGDGLGIFKVEIQENDTTTTTVYESNADKFYKYVIGDDSVIRYDIDEQSYKNALKQTNYVMRKDLDELSAVFDLFKYESSKGMYYLSESPDATFDDALNLLKFVKGKVTEYICPGNKGEKVDTVIDYGSADDLTAPADFTDGGTENPDAE